MVLKNTVDLVGIDKEYAIIDGQQRFATLLILSAVIRDLAASTGDKTFAEKITNDFLTFTSEDGRRKVRLVLQDRDDVEFRKILTDNSKDLKAESSIYEAYQYFYGELKKETPKLHIYFSLLGALKVITITLDEKDDPHRIFETLNSRGKDLTEADLVRNYFIMRMVSVKDQTEVYKNYWKPLEELFEGDKTEELEINLNDFFSDFASMKMKSLVKKDSVYSTIKGLYGLNSTKDDMLEEMKEIFKFGSIYSKMLFPEREKDPQIMEKLRRIRASEIYTVYPLLLYLLYLFQELKQINKEELLETLTYLESYIFRRIYSGEPTNSLNKFFPTLCKLASPNLSQQVMKALSKETYNLKWPDLIEFATGVSEFQAYKRNRNVTKLTLELLEKNHKLYEPLDFKKLEIEHVLPQTLNNKWKEYLGANAEELHERYCHTLANLTLITKPPNESISNDLFSEKKEKWYKYSGVKLTADIVKNYKEWKKDEIEKRSSAIFPELIKIWPHPKDKEILDSLAKS
jgi:uncharacterized protein with ParB-like and HNH nuclease domain